MPRYSTEKISDILSHSLEEIRKNISTYKDFRLDILQKVVQTVAEQQILIMDGGAISLFSKGALPFPKAQIVFTPHKKEWEGLSGLSLSDQTAAANQAAVNQLPLGSIVVQKKHGTTIYQSGQDQVFELTVGGPY